MIMVYKGQPPISRARAIWILFMTTTSPGGKCPLSLAKGWELGVPGATIILKPWPIQNQDGILTCWARMIVKRSGHTPYRLSFRRDVTGCAREFLLADPIEEVLLRFRQELLDRQLPLRVVCTEQLQLLCELLSDATV